MSAEGCVSSSDRRLAPALERSFVSNDPLRYSDDSEMMIAVAESLVRRGTVDTDHLLVTLAQRFDVARGYGHGMRLALQAAREGSRSVAFLVWPEGSKGNGGAVRVVPIACRYHDDLDRLASLTDRATAITHAHPDARAGALLHARAIACALTSEAVSFDGRACLTTLASAPQLAGMSVVRKLAVVDELLANGVESREAAARLGNGVLAEEAVPLALYCFLRTPTDLVEVVRASILAGGDTDTVAAMSASLCGALVGEDALPARWLARLENGPAGRDAVIALADAVHEATAGRHQPGDVSRGMAHDLQSPPRDRVPLARGVMLPPTGFRSRPPPGDRACSRAAGGAEPMLVAAGVGGCATLRPSSTVRP